MKIGILGSGDVGQALGKGFADLKHQVMIGSREPQSEKLQAWMKKVGGQTQTGTFEQAAAFGDVIVVATLGVVVESVVQLAGKEKFAGKIVIDVTNPLDFSHGMPPSLAFSGQSSGGEKLQELLPLAKVVKTLNIVGNPQMVNPHFADGEPDMLLCGNDGEAKQQVVEMLKAFGWSEITDLGGIEMSRYQESLCILWVVYGIKHNNWNIAFKMLQK